MNISRSFIYSKYYPKQKRLSKCDVKKLFWDFYALELLHASTKDVLEANRVERMMDETTTNLLNELVKALEASIRGESRYFIKACRNKSGNYGGAVEGVPEHLKDTYKNTSPCSLSLETIREIFKKSVWHDSYGGKSWANATDVLIRAKNALNSQDLKQMIFYTDHVFDLHHNNGFILDKTNFGVLEDDDFHNHLDVRHRLKSLKSFGKRQRRDRYIVLSKEVASEVDRFLSAA